jgi:ankyrin repeat protein
MRNSSVSFRHPVVLLMLFMALLGSNAIWAQTADNSRSAALFRVIRFGNAAELESLLSKGADANDSLNGYSALMAAALNGTVEQMKILIAHGAKVNYRTGEEIGALWLAVPDWDKTILLLDHGADVQQKIQGYSILVKLAAMPGTVKIIRLLIDKGADPKNGGHGNYFLYNAAGSGDTAILGLAIRSGLGVNDTTSYGDAPINAALGFRGFANLKMLVEHGANVDFQSMTIVAFPAVVGFTPLMDAAFSGDSLSFFFLLDHGANPNLRTKKGFTALMLLEQAEIDNPAMTLALIDHGARVSDKAPDGTDALYYAQKKGNTRSVDILKRYLHK